ncbi:MAG: hypothetical protein V1870_03110 [Candidatus Aenigmatarchaeota archaeon]
MVETREKPVVVKLASDYEINLPDGRELRFEEAKELSRIKWEYFHEHPDHGHDELVKRYPALDVLMSSCGFCEKYLNELGDHKSCPLYGKYQADHKGLCCREYHMWNKQFCADDMIIKSKKFWSGKLLKRIEKAVERTPKLYYKNHNKLRYLY